MRPSTALHAILPRLALSGILALAPATGAAQDSTRMPLALFVGSDRERYLRTLQTVGEVPLYPWSIRGFSPREIDSLRPAPGRHPWSTSPRFYVSAPASGARKEAIPVHFGARYNTAFPFGYNDGAVWAGRGLTFSALGGGAVRQGRVSIIAAPEAFLAENRAFPLMPNGQAGNLGFADPSHPTVITIDRPQRFGSGSYGRVEPGQSTARIDLAPIITLGFSTASQWWGPMVEFPYLLGNNAPGFPHFFFGSAKPWNVGIGRLHSRVIYGSLSQSAYIDTADSLSRRFATGIIATFSPRGAPGLELGFARFFHMVWPTGGLDSDELGRPFESFLKVNLPEPDEDPNAGLENQLASLFVRWVLPGSGAEIYGEFGRDDHNFDRNDLLQEPDHDATYAIGIQKAWKRESGAIVSIRGELINANISSLARHRGQAGPYVHGTVRQGHTHRGQLLGTGFLAGRGGAGTTIRFDRYAPAGAESVTWSRLVRQDRAGGTPSGERCSTACIDVQHVLRAQRQRWYGRLEVRYGLGVVYEMNRNFDHDDFNWNPEVEVRWHP
jgi:Capsule assembly protein Wzi